MKTKPIAIIAVLSCTALTSSAQILFKFASAGFSLDIISLLTNHYLIAGLLTYAIAAVFLLAALKHGELSVIYPIIATSYIWVSLLSPMFFPADYMNAMKWLGIFFIIIGVISVGWGGRNG